MNLLRACATTLASTCLGLVLGIATATAQTDNSAPATVASSVPAAGQCGYLSTRQGVVPESENIFSANITQVDGDSTSFMRASRHKVAAGSHTLTISENIDQKRLTQSQLVQIRKMKKFARLAAYKPLVVDVAPDVTYWIGARLLTDRLDAQSIRENAYWEPVLWHRVAGKCP